MSAEDGLRELRRVRHKATGREMLIPVEADPNFIESDYEPFGEVYAPTPTAAPEDETPQGDVEIDG